MPLDANATSAFDDYVEVDLTTSLPPLKMSDVFGEEEATVARAIEVVSGGDLQLRLANRKERIYTALPAGWTVEVQFTDILATNTTATKVRVGR